MEVNNYTLEKYLYMINIISNNNLKDLNLFFYFNKELLSFDNSPT